MRFGLELVALVAVLAVVLIATKTQTIGAAPASAGTVSGGATQAAMPVQAVPEQVRQQVDALMQQARAMPENVQ